MIKTSQKVSLLALATVACSAHAQSSVTVSGFLDVGLYRDFDKATKLGTIQRSSLTFSGNEDLGGGYAATFVLQTRFEMGTGELEGAGAKPFWEGESTVGLKGPFGAVRLGRALDVISAADWTYDPWGNFNRVASPAWNNWHWNYASDRTSNNGTPEYGRVANGVFYDSPSFGGFSVHLSGAYEEQPFPGAGTGNNFGASLNYGNGPVSLMLAHNKNSNDDDDTFVGARYDFAAISLMGAYDESTYAGTLATPDSKAKVYTLGATYTTGATTWKAGYGRRDTDGVKNDFIGLGADYALSKRTILYVSAGYNKPDDSASSNAYGVGMSHSF